MFMLSFGDREMTFHVLQLICISKGRRSSYFPTGTANVIKIVSVMSKFHRPINGNAIMQDRSKRFFLLCHFHFIQFS